MTDDLWPLVTWLVAGCVCLGIGLGTAFGILSPSLTLDLVALWPLPALAFATAVALWFLARSKPRLLAIPGLLLLTWLVAGLAFHLAAEPWLPSGQGDIDVTIDAPAALLQIEMLTGEISVASGDTDGYRITSLRQGGQSGPPGVFEQAGEDRTTVVVIPRDGGSWYRFKGWRFELRSGPAWELEMVAPVVRFDSQGLTVDKAMIRAARADVDLGPGGVPATLDVTGSATIHLNADATALVVGQASTPEAWVTLSDGTVGNAGPGDTADWRIVVHQGSAVTVMAD